MTYTPTDQTLWDPSQAVTWVSGQVDNPSANWKAMCLALTSNAYGYGGSGVNSANDYWDGSWHRHDGDRSVPTGGLACFRSGTYGHIMTCVDGGNGTFVSNDIFRTGKADFCTIGDIERGWGQQYLGWTEPCYWAGWGNNPYSAAPPSNMTDGGKTKQPEEDMGYPIFMGTIPDEGGRIYRLAPGEPKTWIDPQKWGIYCRLFPYWASLPGSPYLEAEVDLINADIQPNA